MNLRTTTARAGREALALAALAALLLPLTPAPTSGQSATTTLKVPTPAYQERAVEAPPDLADLQKLDPNMQREIKGLIRKHLEERKAREGLRAQIAQLKTPEEGDLDRLKQMLDRRQAEVERLRKQIEATRPGRGATVRIEIATTGSPEELKGLVAKVEKALAGKAKIVHVDYTDRPAPPRPPQPVPGPITPPQPVPPTLTVPATPATPAAPANPFQLFQRPGLEVPQAAGGGAERRIDALERKLERVLRELDRLRRDVKRSGAADPARPTPGPGATTTTEAVPTPPGP